MFVFCNKDIYIPYLIYCVEVWGNAADIHPNDIFLLQKKIVRIINYSHYKAHTHNICINLDILLLQKIVYHRISVMMYTFVNDMLPIAMNELYMKNNEIHNNETRHCNHLHLPRGINTKNFVHKSAKIWNELTNIDIDDSVYNK